MVQCNFIHSFWVIPFNSCAFDPLGKNASINSNSYCLCFSLTRVFFMLSHLLFNKTSVHFCAHSLFVYFQGKQMHIRITVWGNMLACAKLQGYLQCFIQHFHQCKNACLLPVVLPTVRANVTAMHIATLILFGMDFVSEHFSPNSKVKWGSSKLQSWINTVSCNRVQNKTKKRGKKKRQTIHWQMAMNMFNIKKRNKLALLYSSASVS